MKVTKEQVKVNTEEAFEREYKEVLEESLKMFTTEEGKKSISKILNDSTIKTLCKNMFVKGALHASKEINSIWKDVFEK